MNTEIALLAEMKKDSGGNKYVIDANKLTIYDVKKGKDGRGLYAESKGVPSGDNAVYQCKAENKHGYVWTNFYLNLLGSRFSDPRESLQPSSRSC